MAAPAPPSEAPSAPATGAAATITTKSPKPAPRKLGVRAVLSLPQTYASFIAKNQSQVSQIESALRSLTYVIPGRFRDAEIASEAIHSGVQLLSMYHDTLLERAAADDNSSSSRSPSKTAPSPSTRTIHSRYTTFWSQKSPLYRRVARALQIVQYTQLLIEMAAKRRGDDRLRWRLVVLVEAFKALCKLILLRITRGRPLVTPALPERRPIPPPDDDDSSKGEYVIPPELRDGDDDDDNLDNHHKAATANGTAINGHANGHATTAATHSKEWHMPRTRSVLPSLPDSADINSY
ncbi:peroxisomal membrane protein PEX16, partial [Magnaporthiopsis poae ATCC 64411]